jgi:hypothetical protein
MDPLSGLNIDGAGATTSKMALPEGLSRDESDAEIDDCTVTKRPEPCRLAAKLGPAVGQGAKS